MTIELTSHTMSRVDDLLKGEARINEKWEISDDGSGDSNYVLTRLISEGTEDDHDELVLEAVVRYEILLWSSDPKYPFFITDPNHQRVFSEIPDFVCDLLEEHTGLDLTAARPK